MAKTPFYVDEYCGEMSFKEVPVKHDNITDIATYLRLCGAPHNLEIVVERFELLHAVLQARQAVSTTGNDRSGVEEIEVRRTNSN